MFMYRLVSMTAIENFHQPRRGVKNSEAVCIIPVTHASLTLWAASTPALVAPQLHRIPECPPRQSNRLTGLYPPCTDFRRLPRQQVLNRLSSLSVLLYHLVCFHKNIINFIYLLFADDSLHYSHLHYPGIFPCNMLRKGKPCHRFICNGIKGIGCQPFLRLQNTQCPPCQAHDPQILPVLC